MSISTDRQTQENENNNNLKGSENETLKKVTEYFESRPILEESEIENFLKYIDLYDSWKDDLQIIWGVLMRSSIDDKVDLSSALKGIQEILGNDAEMSLNSLEGEIPLFSIDNAINEFDAKKLIEIKKALLLIKIDEKDVVNYTEILNLVNNHHNYVNATYNEIVKILMVCDKKQEITSTDYKIDKTLLAELKEKIDKKIGEEIQSTENDYRIELAIDIMKHYSKKILDDEEVNDCLYILESFNQDNKKKKEQLKLQNFSQLEVAKENEIQVIGDKRFPFLSFEEYQQHTSGLGNSMINKTSLSASGFTNSQNISTNTMKKSIRRMNTPTNHFTTLNSQSLVTISSQNVKPRSSHGYTSLSNVHITEINNTTGNLGDNKEKPDDISNSRCDLFSVQDNQTDKFLFETTNLLDNTEKEVRISSAISEAEPEGKPKQQYEFSNSFHSKASFLSQKKNNIIEEVENEDDIMKSDEGKNLQPKNMPETVPYNPPIPNSVSSMNYINTFPSVSGLNSTGYKSNISNNNIVFNVGGNQSVKSTLSHSSSMLTGLTYGNSSKVNESRSVMSLSLLRNDELSSILQTEALGSRSTCYDFLKLKDNKEVEKMLKKNNENSSPYEFFSNYVYIYKKNVPKKLILLITNATIYLLDCKNYSVYKQVSLKKLIKITLSQKMFNILVFHFNDEVPDDILIEVLRRLELLFYFKALYKFKGYGHLLIKFPTSKTNSSNIIHLKKNNVMVTYNLSKKSLLTTPNYDNAIKIGYLQVYIEGFFKKKFKEKFIVLSDIGLMILDTPNTMPQMVVPIIGSEIKKVDFMKYNVYAFSIKTPNGEICIFGARTEGERQAWCDEFSQIKSIYKEKMKMVEKKK